MRILSASECKVNVYLQVFTTELNSCLFSLLPFLTDFMVLTINLAEHMRKLWKIFIAKSKSIL